MKKKYIVLFLITFIYIYNINLVVNSSYSFEKNEDTQTTSNVTLNDEIFEMIINEIINDIEINGIPKNTVEKDPTLNNSILGQVLPLDTKVYYSNSSYQVVEVIVSEKDVINKGDLILTTRDNSLHSDLSSKQNELNNLKEQLMVHESNHNRKSILSSEITSLNSQIGVLKDNITKKTDPEIKDSFTKYNYEDYKYRLSNEQYLDAKSKGNLTDAELNELYTKKEQNKITSNNLFNEYKNVLNVKTKELENLEKNLEQKEIEYNTLDLLISSNVTDINVRIIELESEIKGISTRNDSVNKDIRKIACDLQKALVTDIYVTNGQAVDINTELIKVIDLSKVIVEIEKSAFDSNVSTDPGTQVKLYVDDTEKYFYGTIDLVNQGSIYIEIIEADEIFANLDYVRIRTD